MSSVNRSSPPASPPPAPLHPSHLSNNEVFSRIVNLGGVGHEPQCSTKLLQGFHHLFFLPYSITTKSLSSKVEKTGKKIICLTPAGRQMCRCFKVRDLITCNCKFKCRFPRELVSFIRLRNQVGFDP